MRILKSTFARSFSLLMVIGLLAPEFAQIPVAKATHSSWNPLSYWAEPWGTSGVHKGIDIFAPKGTPVLATTYGIVLFSGEIEKGGKVVLMLGPKWRLHYYAHLDSVDAGLMEPIVGGESFATVGDTGNAKGKPPHLHYSIVTLIPYPWRIDGTTQGWKKMFFLDPGTIIH